MSDIKDKDIWIERDFSKRNTICYTKESIRHPAKMNLDMCRKIIKLYSKPGDVILDPMVGIGTTIIEGMILGRNVVGVEYEQKFVDLAAQNIEKTTKSLSFMKTLGKGQIIKGDSRELSKVIKEKADSIMFSPHFADQQQVTEKMVEEGKMTPTAKKKYGYSDHYSTDKNNIGNLKHGQIDSIITSPPYEDMGVSQLMGSVAGQPGKKINEIIAQDTVQYSTDPENIGNKQGKNYLTEMLIIYKECFKVLKKDGYMVLVTKNFVRAGKQIRLDSDTIKICEAAGFKYIKQHYRKIKNPSFWITNAIQKWEKKHKEPHPYPLVEDILVFRKQGDDKK